MKIMFLTQYFPPEVGAPQNRIFELAKLLVNRGHEVTVLTGMPCYPANEIFDGYKGKLLMKEEIDGVKVVRTWLYATKNPGFIPRLMNYFSFTFSSLFIGTFSVAKQDVVITESPPLFLGMSGYLISILKRAKFIFNVSDLWPESAVKLGVLNNKQLIKLSTWLEEFCYKKSALILGQTKGIIDNINQRGYDNTYLLTNGVDTSFFNKDKANNELRNQLKLQEKFLVCYAGIIGIAQGLDLILDCAEKLKDNKDVHFLLIGEGPEKQRLIKKAENLSLENISFVPLQPKEKMPGVIAAMDATIIPLKNLDLFKGALPSKMFEALASELPIILSVDGEAKKLIEASGGGITVEPENVEQVTKAILKLYEDTDFAKKLGENGRAFVKEHYAREIIAQKFEEKLLSLKK
ncbi:glycosyltransferase family 4 protein [Bacillus mobilis]|uniref:glycosyltransferase family 4 protein n=1 Tax=Bacillus mobilis TaxID=2026190 RepID=UPI000A301264|nr:glycosyltransferase family 4 protein [Bacillus mobilis]MCU5594425.1 glycosyltransferase family 4 protein [Bacillus mobilis]MCU5739489.1 glycosyltransferase family 4 protein [Bacillus mobilis]MCU9558182.1 glycosyltransferase family 4 protein [Bacillus mobilis]SMD72990.1 Alpha-D-kanosaminyltransferase [Bacillus mobilis]HDR7514043.1 glycosyltransferase family 4 protein [Bacillus mobilis]